MHTRRWLPLLAWHRAAGLRGPAASFSCVRGSQERERGRLLRFHRARSAPRALCGARAKLALCPSVALLTAPLRAPPFPPPLSLCRRGAASGATASLCTTRRRPSRYARAARSNCKPRSMGRRQRKRWRWRQRRRQLRAAAAARWLCRCLRWQHRRVERAAGRSSIGSRQRAAGSGQGRGRPWPRAAARPQAQVASCSARGASERGASEREEGAGGALGLGLGARAWAQPDGSARASTVTRAAMGTARGLLRTLHGRHACARGSLLSPPPSRSQECREFKNGRCSRGDACRFNHVGGPTGGSGGGSGAAFDERRFEVDDVSGSTRPCPTRSALPSANAHSARPTPCARMLTLAAPCVRL